MNEDEKWRYCDDPAELAAAVAELGRKQVQVELPGEGWESTGSQTADSFAASLRAGCRYRLPVSWSWSPEPPADVPTGAERYLAERLADPEYRAAYEAAAPAAGDDLRERIARAIYEEDHDGPWKNANHPDWVRSLRSADAVLAVLPTPAPPVPPWPGAVLSGLTDEDGQPTWLAQAGQVRGEQVRDTRHAVWAICEQDGNLHPYAWVEVRAPRAVPEPETERVPWWEAVGREVFDQDGERVTIEHVQCGDGAGPSVTAYNAAKRRDTSLLRVPITVRGDGTVEVLKDGES